KPGAIATGGDLIAMARALLNEHRRLEQVAARHYEQTLHQGLQIQTPDADVNRALAWAQVALEQAWVCNTDLGCGQVAGYGPSRKARRPQYNWFFAGDGMIATRALLAAGRNDRAREQLEFIIKYQDRKTGMIWHELSQSAGAMEWHKYPYMFGHVDLSYDFLEILAEYYTTTGDLGFIKQHWSAIEAAYRYCRSLLDNKDGLPRIPSDKQGSNEQDALSEELTLSAGWIAASEAYATLAKAVGRQGPAKTALAASLRAHQVVSENFWDEQRRFWISGLTRAGSPLLDRDIRGIGVVKQSLFSPEQRGIALDQIASADFQTDWGTRGKAANDPTYDPHLYASGSVWAIGTAGVTSAFWAAHRPATAFPIWSALVPWSWLDSPGHMHETLAGDFYRPGIESVPEQTWSSASFLTTTVQDLIGLRVNGVARRLQLAPHLPASWDKLTVQRVRVGDAMVSLSLEQTVGETTLRIRNDGNPVKVSFDPELPLGATIQGATVDQRAVDATLTQNSQDTHARVDFDLPRGEATVRIAHSGGVALSPPVPHPIIGEPSRAAKVVGVSLTDRTYSIEFDHRPSESTRFELRTAWQIDKVTGAEIEARTPLSYQLLIKATADPKQLAYQRNKIVVTFAKE
ncbi:amylo-alpha-1,6-glucosidase, partial [Steroidobacter sp.]|uniref:amylo-alpha-1,6-glucosidase n=1 Tax=Steroidobacter sp. TaxID=1978227 RepID=UPI001A4195EC